MMTIQNDNLFKPINLHYPCEMSLSFSDYIAQCKQLIASTRLDLQYGAHKIILANSPFELKPKISGKYGALLAHGLYDSPFILKDIGIQLQTHGLLVRSILLPGHGTVPAALLKTQYTQWQQTLDFGVASFSPTVEKIFLVGFSTGAILSLLKVLQQNQPKIAGIIAIAPAIRIRSPFAYFSKWHKVLGYGRGNWLHICKENDYTKYQSYTLNSVYQVYALTEILKNIKKNLSCPALFVIAQDDRTVSANAAINYFKTYTNAHSKMIIYTNKKNKPSDARIITRPARYPELNISNFSHVALSNSPDNFHYGREGDYRTHRAHFIYGSRNDFENQVANFFYKMGLTQHAYMRLTYNPDFQFLTDSIIEFILN